MARTPEKAGDNDDSRRRRGKRDEGSQNNQRDDDRGDFIDKIVAINRVAKVVKGGKRFGFAALIVMGDGKGRVGYGTGKAREVPEAIRKATESAKRGMMRIPLREGRTIHHDVKGMFGAGLVVLRAAPAGTGIIAGGPMRAVFEALGVQDVVAKSVGTSNPHNMVKATFAALTSVSSPRSVANRRGKKINEIFGKKPDDKSAAVES
jgi:small subunit ribosomal protein S5